MATLDGEGLHKPQDIMMSPWAVQRYDEPGDLDLPTTFDIDYQNLSLLLQEAAILYPQCAKPKLYPTIQPYISVSVTTPVVPVRSVAVVTKDPYYSEGNRSGQGPTHTTDYREYDTSAVPLRRKHNNKLPLSACCGTAVNMGSSRQETTAECLWTGIKPAVLLGIKPRHIKHGFTVRTLEFEVPLDHHHTSQKDALLKLHAELVDSFPDDPKPTPDVLSSPISTQKPFILYLCGGPGDGNPSDRVPELNKFCIDRGYQVLYVHYRGTGQSPLFFDSTAEAKVLRMSDQDKANYLAKFRQDNIVRDLEAIRLCLNKHLSLPKEKEIKWTLIGQSFGGWVATTYLSFVPQSLEAVYISAGMPPLGKTPREVYEKTYAHIVKRNEDYFNEYFPEDQEHVRTIVEHLRDKAPLQKGVDGQPPFRGYALDFDKERKGCYLTYQTFMTLGRTFGSAPVVRRDRDEDEDEEELPLSLTSSIGALTIRPSKSSLASNTTLDTTCTGTPPLSASYRSSSTSFTSISTSDLSSLAEPRSEIPPTYQKLHTLITQLISDLNSSSGISTATLTIYTNLESFALHRRPLYALLHEAIYCSSTCPLTRQPSNWAATEVALSHPSGGFSWLSLLSSKTKTGDKLYFTGETLHPPPTLLHLGGPTLTPFLRAAELLAQKSDWPSLYDPSSLRQNQDLSSLRQNQDLSSLRQNPATATATATTTATATANKGGHGGHGVKVRAVAYQEDMYVDLELSKEAVGMIGGCELVVCPFRSWGHGSIKEAGKGETVLGWLFDGV